MRTPALLVLAATLAFAGCGGGGSSSVNPSTSGGNMPGAAAQSPAENAINTANALGNPVKTLTNYNSTISANSVGRAPVTMSVALGACANNREFFAPDKNGDPNSTEAQYFYDSGCTQLARDTVRLYTIDGSSETVGRTEKIYAINNTTASATRSDTTTIANASFDQYGFPNIANGFQRSSTGYLAIAGTRTIDSDEELVMMPGSGGVNIFCSDSAGFNATGFQSLNETFGWQGGVLGGGTRTVNGDGSVTWSATHTGSTFKGAIGSLSIAVGTANTACPISTPEYSLSGGTQGGTYSIPVSATYKGGLLTNLTVTNATLANGNSLNVTTNSAVSPTSSGFITGTVSNNGTQIATFAVDAFGDGTLTVASSGAQYVITDWHVVK